MESTIDRAGRVVIPKKLREQAGLGPDARIEIEFSDGVIHIRPAPAAVRLERRGPFLVAVPTDPMPPLTTGDVSRVRDEIDRERGR